MKHVRIPRSVCAVVGNALIGSHRELDALFLSSGAPGPPPDLAHALKWKTWLFEACNDPEVDGLLLLGNIIEELMDVAPSDELGDFFVEWTETVTLINLELKKAGLQYFRGGRVLPIDGAIRENKNNTTSEENAQPPRSVDELIERLIKGLRNAMYPLTNRRKGATALTFNSEYDVQDLLHSLMRPWIKDIRPEEYTPSYAGSSTRMDFLLPEHETVLEIKFVRDIGHGRKVGNELIIDIEHYRHHSNCKVLWCIIYDPNNFIQNSTGLIRDLEGKRKMDDGCVTVKATVV